MAGYKWARWLPEALEAEGCKVVLEPGWRNRGRYRADGRRDLPPNWPFDPDGLVSWHHTGVTSTPGRPWPTGAVLINGRSDLSGPLCQASPDHKGVMHVVAAGRANHAGKMSGAGPSVRGEDGNIRAIGFEIDTNGTQRIPTAQYRSAIRGAAAVIRRYNRNASWALGHAESSVTGKWDPGENGKTVDLNAWRRDLAECLSYPPGVWKSRSGSWSWGELKLSELKLGVDATHRGTIRRLQYRIKRANPGKVPASVRKAVKLTGVWDDATIAAVAAWQKNVYAPRTDGPKDGYQGGRKLGGNQADVLFGSRYKLVP